MTSTTSSTRPATDALAHAPVRIVGIVASPHASAKTSAAVAAVLEGLRRPEGAETELIALTETDTAVSLDAVESADAVVFGSPVYRAAHTSLLSSFLEALERGKKHENRAPLQGTAAAIVMTGGSAHHFLASGSLLTTLSGFFAAQVLSPPQYFEPGDFTDSGALTDEAAARAYQTGAALGELAAALSSSRFLKHMEPQI